MGEIADILVLQGEVQLARAVRHFVRRLPPARTERERIREELLGRAETRQDPGLHLRSDTTGGERSETPLGAYWRGFGPIRALTRSSAHDGGAQTPPNPKEDRVRAPDATLTAAERLRRRSDAIAAQLIAERDGRVKPSKRLGKLRRHGASLIGKSTAPRNAVGMVAESGPAR